MLKLSKIIFLSISILILHGCATPKAIHCSEIDEELRPINQKYYGEKNDK